MFVPRAAALLAMVGALAFSGVAHAASTVSMSGGVMTITGDDAVNHFVPDSYPALTRAQIKDDQPGAVVNAGAGCTNLSVSWVDCGDFPVGGSILANLGGGDDYYKWATIDTPQTIDGGDGADTIETGNGNDTVRGNAGKDDLTGGRGDDTMDGGDGDDKVDGWDGSDSITGGAGRDNLLGDGGTLYSGGNDTIYARDGESDTVDCGGGADRAEVDAAGTDTVSACATTLFPASSGGTNTTGNGGAGSTPPTAADLTVAGGISVKQTPSALASGKKLSLRVTANATCSAKAALAVGKAEAKRLKLGTKATTLGTSASTTLAANTPVTIQVGVSQRYRSKLRKASKIKAAVVIVCVDASNRTFSGQLDVTIKR